MKQRIPVIMYHSIGVVNPNWQWEWLTCPYKIFENQLKWLKKLGFYTLNFHEMYDYVMLDKEVPKRSVFLTFDDGYFDNYFFAYPLLKKFGMKGTIFVNPDFVDPSSGCRKTFVDINSENEIDNYETSGFCNWDELRRIDQEGVLDVQSHAKTHTWYPVSDDIIDFRHPGDSYIWMDWNEHPERKPELQSIKRDQVPYGKAIFEHKMALSSPRVFINEDFQNSLHNYVVENGNLSFFRDDNWKTKLMLFSEKLKLQYPIVVHKESNEEYLKRIRFELEFTKSEIESRLNKEVKFLCWPGGSGTKEGVAIAHDLGYIMSTAAQDVTAMERKNIINSPDYKINKISRIGPLMYHRYSKKDDKYKPVYSPGYFFVLQMFGFNSNRISAFFLRYVKAISVMIDKAIHV